MEPSTSTKRTVTFSPDLVTRTIMIEPEWEPESGSGSDAESEGQSFRCPPSPGFPNMSPRDALLVAATNAAALDPTWQLRQGDGGEEEKTSDEQIPVIFHGQDARTTSPPAGAEAAPPSGRPNGSGSSSSSSSPLLQNASSAAMRHLMPSADEKAIASRIARLYALLTAGEASAQMKEWYGEHKRLLREFEAAKARRKRGVGKNNRAPRDNDGDGDGDGKDPEYRLGVGRSLTAAIPPMTPLRTTGFTVPSPVVLGRVGPPDQTKLQGDGTERVVTLDREISGDLRARRLEAKIVSRVP